MERGNFDRFTPALREARQERAFLLAKRELIIQELARVNARLRTLEVQTQVTMNRPSGKR